MKEYIITYKDGTESRAYAEDVGEIIAIVPNPDDIESVVPDH